MRIIIRFPLGMYHAQSQASFIQPEWPPHPVRLIGALVAAAHSPSRAEQDDESFDEDLKLVHRLCTSGAPLIGAPEAVPLGEAAAQDVALAVTGATRWAPRNYFTKGGREQAEVQKVGIAVGDQPIQFIWPTLDLDSADLKRLANLVADITFLGTTRSPVVASVVSEESPDPHPLWTPVEDNAASGIQTVAVRVPDSTTLATFERRHKARRSSTSRLQAATTAVPGIRIGRELSYVPSSALGKSTRLLDPHWWGDMIVLAIDKDRSDVLPRSAASYLLARAVRTALLGAYGSAGGPAEAPAILRGRGPEAHCAIVPLADVWHEGARGLIRGVAILLPNERRTEDLPLQRVALEAGLANLVRDTDSGPQRYVQIPGSGRVWLRQPSTGEASLKTLLKRTYRATAKSWSSVSPVMHARWRKGPEDTRLDQITRDCLHVGLPAPAHVEGLRGSEFPGAASRSVPPERVPTAWRKSLGGPSSHIRITFTVPVVGPVLLGRARHFGLGLLVPGAAAPKLAGQQRHPETV